MSDSEARARLTAMYDEWAPGVYGYARRHCCHGDADDVVAETFAIAWRRLDQVPDPAIGWLIATARNVVANRRRSSRRAAALTGRLSDHVQVQRRDTPAAEETAMRRAAVLHALDQLTGREREALLLTAWDGLSHVEAAAVAQCSPRAFRARLTRARQRLEVLLDPEPPGVIRTSTDPATHSVRSL